MAKLLNYPLICKRFDPNLEALCLACLKAVSYIEPDRTGPEMTIEQIPAAGDRNFAYLLAVPEDGAAAIIDPGAASEKLGARLRALGLALRFVICTHHHHDHTAGWRELVGEFGARLAAFENSPLQANLALTDGAELRLGGEALRIIHTPGHTEDSICIHVAGAVFTGDTLFVGKGGGTDYGDGARRQYDSLHLKLTQLPDDTVVYPGHDVGFRPFSTIGEEKAQNPFLLQPDFEHFVSLKRNWLAYKTKHGIK